MSATSDAMASAIRLERVCDCAKPAELLGTLASLLDCIVDATDRRQPERRDNLVAALVALWRADPASGGQR